MRFLTPIYHPNIDNSGRICHDALKLPPKVGFYHQKNPQSCYKFTSVIWFCLSAVRFVLFVFVFITKGAWRPSLNISTVLTLIQLLMTEPNPDDPLMADIVSHT